MPHRNLNRCCRLIAVRLATLFLILLNSAASAQEAGSRLEQIKRIQGELEILREKKFKHIVQSSTQSQEDFSKYLEKNIARQVPERLLSNYDKVIRKVGLYRGPEITDFGSMVRQVMQSQAAAYYDPEKETFYVVMQELDDQMLETVYSHELYHGFQDQHFDLDNYVLNPAGQSLNDDQLLARQAVVEGEATYIMTLWSMKKMLGQVPAPAMLRMAIQMQAQMDASDMLKLAKKTFLPGNQHPDLKQAMGSVDRIPAFLLESMIGAYLKGMAFIFEIRQIGWDKVAELYRNPPLSTEQILHHEKWLDNERPVNYEWPDFDEDFKRDWQLLESNTIGELQWRIIFAEHGLAASAHKAAAGWDGDSFLVFEDKDGALLLLLATSWDNEEEAIEFEQNYKKLLEHKYPEKRETVTLKRNGREVIIIEGAKTHEKIIRIFEGMGRKR